MIPAPEIHAPAHAWSDTTLGYPLASVVVEVARDQDRRHTTGRDEDRAR